MAKFEVNEELVRKLADLLQETGLNEIEYEVNNHRIRVAKNAGVTTVAAPPVAVAAGPQGPAAPAGGPEAVPAGAITAPMVGTVYVSGEPGAPPFVKVGDEIREGQTLLIIEAMKVMNQVPAPRAGTVREILVANADPVEYGEVLMVIE